MSLGLMQRQQQASCEQGDLVSPPQQNWLCEHSPLGFYGGDTNLYRYVGDDPTNAIDPSGLIKQVADPFWQTAYGKEMWKKIVKAADYTTTTAKKVLEATDKIKPTKEEDKAKLMGFQRELRFIIDNIDKLEIFPTGDTHILPGAQAKPDLDDYKTKGRLQVTLSILFMYNFSGEKGKPYGEKESSLVLPLPGHLGLNEEALKALKRERLPQEMERNEKDRKELKYPMPVITPWTEKQIAALLANELMHFFGEKDEIRYVSEYEVVQYKHFFTNTDKGGAHTWSSLDSLNLDTHKSFKDPRSADHVVQSIYYGRLFWKPE